VLHAAQGRYDQARNALEVAIRLNPNDATAHENLGDVYATLARQAYARAQQIDPTRTTLAPKQAALATLFPAVPAAPPTAK